jgi:hypothetical protein
MEPLPAEVSAFRAEYRARYMGGFYNGWLHFAFTSVGSVAVIVTAITRLRDVRVAELLTIAGTFFFANLAEYFGHKGPMHRPYPGREFLFRRHTREHHHFFTDGAMAYESSRDFKMVLFPPAMLFFFLGVLASPIAALLFVVASPNVAWLYVATAMAYFLSYEWLHFAYHLPEQSALGRLPLLRSLRRHHQTHHDMALMGKWNFNITFPICDWVFGTSWRATTAPSVGGVSPEAPRVTQ